MPIVPTPETGVSQMAFAPSFEPFKAEKKLVTEWEEKGIGWRSKENYPYEYGNEVFRSSAEVEWAKTFDRIGLKWEYEPLKFCMGPKYFSYTPDFRVTGLSIPSCDRVLYIEVKRFPGADDLNLNKYLRFTEWYTCDLLVLADYKGGVLRPKHENYFLVLRCTQCNAYECTWCQELPSDDFTPPRWECVCGHERLVVPSYFLIQAGTIRTARVEFPERTSSGQPIPQTDAQALRGYRKAAEQGDADALFGLGGMYISGEGVAQDLVEAHVWIDLAASRASGDKQKAYADTRERLARLLSPPEIAEAQRRAREWKPTTGPKGTKPAPRGWTRQ